MKKQLTFLTILLLALTAEAQDVYSVGYYNAGTGTIAALYKNNKRLYIAHENHLTSKAVKVACNSEGDIFWLVNFYDHPSDTFHHSEIRINNQIYSSTENHSVGHITDMYCLNDTVYCVGYQYNEESVSVATVWNGIDFTIHWILGDGIHSSVVFDADVDKSTNIPYFCGYITDTLRKASVWESSQLLYKQEPWGYQRGSQANEISVDSGSVYTNGYLNYYTGYESVTFPTIWKDNVTIYDASNLDFIDCLYAHQGNFYYTFYYPHGMYYAVHKNNGEILQLPLNQTGIQRICGDLDDIYMIGILQGQVSIWKNFEVFIQPNNCDAIYDMIVSHTSVSIDETDVNGFAVYPNPANNVLFVETVCTPSLPDQTYHITNIMGQTVLSGSITAETQQINIECLPAGLYFISMGGQTVKFVKQ